MTNLQTTFAWLVFFFFASNTQAQDLNPTPVTIPAKCYRLSLQLPLAFQDTLPWLEGCDRRSDCLEMESADGTMQIKMEVYCRHFYPHEERKPWNRDNGVAVRVSSGAADSKKSKRKDRKMAYLFSADSDPSASSPPADEKAKPEKAPPKPPLDPKKGGENQFKGNNHIMLFWKIVEGRYKTYFQIETIGELDYGYYHFEGRCKVEDWEILMASFRTVKWEEVPQE